MIFIFFFQRLPDNVHELANGVLHISSTDVYSGQNILIDNFQNKAEVIDVSFFCYFTIFLPCWYLISRLFYLIFQAIITSTFIPVFSGYMPPR